MILASDLGKLEHEIMMLSPDEFGRWLAFYDIKPKPPSSPRF